MFLNCPEGGRPGKRAGESLNAAGFRAHFPEMTGNNPQITHKLRINSKKRLHFLKNVVYYSAFRSGRALAGTETQRNCVMVAQRTLTPYVRVQILLPLPWCIVLIDRHPKNGEKAGSHKDIEDQPTGVSKSKILNVL